MDGRLRDAAVLALVAGRGRNPDHYWCFLGVNKSIVGGADLSGLLLVLVVVLLLPEIGNELVVGRYAQWIVQRERLLGVGQHLCIDVLRCAFSQQRLLN